MVECIQSALHCPRCLRGCIPDSRICGCSQKWCVCAMHVQAIEENHHQADVSLQQQDDNFSWHEPTFIRLVSLPRAHECICYIIALKDHTPASTVTSADGIQLLTKIFACDLRDNML